MKNSCSGYFNFIVTEAVTERYSEWKVLGNKATPLNNTVKEVILRYNLEYFYWCAFQVSLNLLCMAAADWIFV